MVSSKDQDASCSKIRTPWWLSGKSFKKVTFGIKVAGDVTFFSLAADEVTRVVFRDS